ncbi:MAG: hypothetical protein WCQ60_01070 [bacterium]
MKKIILVEAGFVCLVLFALISNTIPNAHAQTAGGACVTLTGQPGVLVQSGNGLTYTCVATNISRQPTSNLTEATGPCLSGPYKWSSDTTYSITSYYSLHLLLKCAVKSSLTGLVKIVNPDTGVPITMVVADSALTRSSCLSFCDTTSSASIDIQLDATKGKTSYPGSTFAYVTVTTPSDLVTVKNLISKYKKITILVNGVYSIDIPIVDTSIGVAPTNLIGTAVNPTTINLSWTNTSTATNGIDLERSVSGGAFTQVLQLLPTSTTYTETAAAASTTYKYRIAAITSTGNSAYSNVVTITTPSVNTSPTNLTASRSSSNTNQINLTWVSTSTAATGYIVERAFGTSSLNFIKIATVTSVAKVYTDDLTGLITGSQINYRVRSIFADLSYSEYTNIVTISACASVSEIDASVKLKAIYDKIPADITGKIYLPWYLQEVAKPFTTVINDGIAGAQLNGKPVSDALQQAFQDISWLASQSGIYPSIGEKLAKFIAETVVNLGKKYNLTNDETSLLFSGMASGNAPFTIVNFKFNSNWALIIFGSNIVYEVKKNTTVPWPACVSSSMVSIPAATPAASVASVAPVVGASTGNTFSVTGSGFDTTGNMIKLTPVSQVSAIKSNSLEANTYSLFEGVWNFFKNLIPQVHGQTMTATGYYAIDNVQSNGTALTFSVPATVPDGTYKVSVSGFGSLWTDTTYTIVVSGNGAGDMTTQVSDAMISDLPPIVPPVDPAPPVSTTQPATVVYSCSVGMLTALNKCNVPGSNTYTSPKSIGYTCPDNHYTLSGTMCNLNGGIPIATTQPASTAYNCTSGTTYKLTAANTCNLSNSGMFSLAKVIGYSCTDLNYYVSGQSCVINAVPTATVQPATAKYSCTGNSVLTLLNTCNVTNTGTYSLAKVIYTCSAGYTLSGKSCIRAASVTSATVTSAQSSVVVQKNVVEAPLVKVVATTTAVAAVTSDQIVSTSTIAPVVPAAPVILPAITTIPATKTYTCMPGMILDTAAGTCTTGSHAGHASPPQPASAKYSCPTGYMLNAGSATCSANVSMQTSASTTTASVWDSVIDWLTSWFK